MISISKEILLNLLSTKNLKKISINDLPLYSSWPSRLLGLETFTPLTKSRESNIREYDLEKWKTLKAKFESQNWQSFSEFRDAMYGNSIQPISTPIQNYLMPLDEFIALQAEWLSKTVEQCLPAPAVFELGSGYGAMLIDLATRLTSKNLKFFGADLSENGISLLNQLSRKFNTPIGAFTYEVGGKNSKQLSEFLPKGSVIYTSFCLSCVPNLNVDMLDDLFMAQPKCFILYEPLYPDDSEKSFHALMRKKYIQQNGYNKNLLDVLQKAGEKYSYKVATSDEPILGGNYFFPGSLIILSKI